MNICSNIQVVVMLGLSKNAHWKPVWQVLVFFIPGFSGKPPSR